jgi:hypothetical protein
VSTISQSLEDINPAKRVIDVLRTRLRESSTWERLRRLQRTGFIESLRRWRVTRRILKTRPIITRELNDSRDARCEVHILTWDGDWCNALWTAKSFYYHAGVDWPLVWHEGGSLAEKYRAVLLAHFPASRIWTQAEATKRVEEELIRGGYSNCLQARRRSFMLLKMMDPVILSHAERLLLVDSDVLFFANPTEILDAVAGNRPVNLFNAITHLEDKSQHWFAISKEAVWQRYGIELNDDLNAGLGLVRRDSLTLPMMEEFLGDPDILSEPWLTEQTLQALCGARVGMELLPPTYQVSTLPGLTATDGRPLVAKHYPGLRPYFYGEGIAYLVRQDFLDPVRGIGV